MNKSFGKDLISNLISEIMEEEYSSYKTKFPQLVRTGKYVAPKYTVKSYTTEIWIPIEKIEPQLSTNEVAILKSLFTINTGESIPDILIEINNVDVEIELEEGTQYVSNVFFDNVKFITVKNDVIFNEIRNIPLIKAGTQFIWNDVKDWIMEDYSTNKLVTVEEYLDKQIGEYTIDLLNSQRI